MRRPTSTPRPLPEVVRIKRKRNQSSLQALILEAPRLKRAKSEQFVFKLQRTDNDFVQLPSDGQASLPLLQESFHKADKENTFVIPKVQETDELPEELNDMLSSLLSGGAKDEQPKAIKKRKQKTAPGAVPFASFELEYVYDVYYRDKEVHDTWEKENIGYIKFEEDYDDALADDESDKHLSDDEDSNAEDFYKNDYPEDEDEHSTTDEEDDPNASFEKLTESLHKEAAANSPQRDDGFEDLYDEFYGSNGGGPTDFLASLEDEDGSDDDMDVDEGYEAEYPRQNFFAHEEDDELAKHRDRIFGKLQKMIDEE